GLSAARGFLFEAIDEGRHACRPDLAHALCRQGRKQVSSCLALVRRGGLGPLLRDALLNPELEEIPEPFGSDDNRFAVSLRGSQPLNGQPYLFLCLSIDRGSPPILK